MDSWRHPDTDTKKRPKVVHIYKCILKKELMDAYMAYQCVSPE